MNKYYLFGLIALVSIMGLGFLLGRTGTSTNAESSPKPSTAPLAQKIETTLPSGAQKIEVLHFHATQQCYSCLTIGKLTKAVVEEKFSEEFNSGKITFKEVNIDLPENLKIAQDYGVSGSALFINVIKDGQDHREEDVTVWRLVSNQSQLNSYFEAKLKALL